MLYAKIFAERYGFFAELALKVCIAGAVEDAAARKAPGIDGALAVFTIGADAGGHRQQRDVVLGQAGLKINPFRRRQEQPVAEGLKIAALAAGLAGHGGGRECLIKPGI